MATRQDVIGFIKTKYKHEDVGDFIVKLEVPLSNGRSQVVYAAVTDQELQVTSPVAWHNRIGGAEILSKNLSMFGIVSVNGAYALKHNAFLRDIDESEIENAFIVLAFQADGLETQLGFEDEF